MEKDRDGCPKIVNIVSWIFGIFEAFFWICAILIILCFRVPQERICFMRKNSFVVFLDFCNLCWINLLLIWRELCRYLDQVWSLLSIKSTQIFARSFWLVFVQTFVVPYVDRILQNFFRIAQIRSGSYQWCFIWCCILKLVILSFWGCTHVFKFRPFNFSILFKIWF
jgi:hypothetical protein